MQALLQLYYMAVAALAWHRWGQKDHETLRITGGGVIYNISILLGWVCLTGGTMVLRKTLGDVDAWLDTATSWGGVLATWMVAQKKLESWTYWIIIDIASAALYLRVGLPASAALYILYTLLAILAWRQWRANYHAVNAN